MTLTHGTVGTASVTAFINSSSRTGAPGIGSPASVTFTAAVNATISFDSAGGSPVAPITQAVGTAVTAPGAPIREGYSFAGWSPAVPATMPVSGAALTAQWTALDYTITFDSAGGSAVAPITQAVGTAVTPPPAPTRAGYSFAGWSSPVPTNMPVGGAVLPALWAPNVSVLLSGGPDVITGTDPFTLTATFSQDVTGFVDLANDVIITNGSVLSISGGPSVYTLTIAATSDGDVTIFIPDAVAQEDRSDSVVNFNSASNTLEIGNQIVAIAQEKIAGFMLSRANSLASNQSDLIRFLDGASCGYFNANVTVDAGSISGCASQGNTWAEATSSWGGGNSYTLGSVGAHAFINSNLLVGGMLQLDHAKDDTNDASGSGWMVGPYFVARMAEQPLFFEGRLLYGESSNSITPSGTYTDHFSSERWLAQLKVQGEVVTERVTWSPSLVLTHSTDSPRAYTDGPGNTIPGQSIGLTQLNSGIGFRWPLDMATGNLQLSGGLAAIYSATHGGNADFEGGRGRINMGLDWNSGNGSTLEFGTFYDGIGSTHESYGATLRFDIRF